MKSGHGLPLQNTFGGILNVFVGRLLDPFFLFSSPFPVCGIQFYGSSFEKKKKKEVSNPLSVVVSRRTSEKTIEWKGGKENEEGEATSLLLSTMRETRHPPPPGRGTNQP